jgi:Thiolase, N-terminal domain.
MREVYVVEDVRAAIAKAGKKSRLANIRADDLAAKVINAVIYEKGVAYCGN